MGSKLIIKPEPVFPFRNELNTVLVAGTVVFLAALFGILTRPTANLAAFWPANALLLGLLLRFPHFATPAGWIAAVMGFILADLATGDPLPQALILAATNLISVAVAYWMYRRYDDNIRRLKRSRAILVMLGNVTVAGAVAGIAGAVIDPILFHGTAWHGWSFWFVTEVVNYLAILPVILTVPKPSWRWLERRRQFTLNLNLLHAAPGIAVLLSCILSVFAGGISAIAFPLPALLWCAVTYNVFTIAVLTLGFSIWTLITVSSQVVNLSIAGGLINVDMLIRIGVALLALVPMILAVVMEARRELMSRLLDIASRDQLTGLLNRHAFRERSTLLLNQLANEAKPVSLLMINIDHFKSVNGTYGYAAGDQALKGFSRIVSQCLRSSDVFGRLGGEEFVVLLPNCLREDAQAVAERIRGAIAGTPIELDQNLQLSITISIGAASTLAAPSDTDPLLLAADSALYRAKKSGRNCIIESEL